MLSPRIMMHVPRFSFRYMRLIALNPRSVLSAIKLTGNVRRFHEQLALSDAQRQTIYALSTPPGKAGIAVVRISGPHALVAWKRMVKPFNNMIAPKPWKLERCDIVYPNEGAELLDDGLAVYFKGAIVYPFACTNSRI